MPKNDVLSSIGNIQRSTTKDIYKELRLLEMFYNVLTKRQLAYWENKGIWLDVASHVITFTQSELLISS